MSSDLIEVEFKRNRKGYYISNSEEQFYPGEFVIVEVEKGIDLGKISQIGRLVIIKNPKEEPRPILRKATEDDLAKLDSNRSEETKAFEICRQYIEKRNLNMKLVEVEYQFDTNKLTFYFTSDQRVDFRELVKDLAARYRTRIELRQISVREEAKKLGGIGICGKELCCTSFMESFSPITTNDAKEQNLPMNPSKICGVCSRLKCCLLYEKGFYTASLKRFPPLDSTIQTDRGTGYVEKIDIFNDNVMIRFEGDEYEQFSLNEINRILKRSQKNQPA